MKPPFITHSMLTLAATLLPAASTTVYDAVEARFFSFVTWHRSSTSASQCHARTPVMLHQVSNEVVHL